jgi:hypothetical protein
VVNVWRNPLSKSPAATIQSGGKDAIKAAAEKPRATKMERDADFQWFSDLSYLDEKKDQFVKVYTSVFGGNFEFNLSFGTDNPTEASGEVSRPAQRTIHGFLLEKRENQFTVLTPSLAKETFKVEPGANEKESIVRFEAADLKSYAAGVLKQLRAPKKADRWNRDIETESALPIFVLAWACSRHGLDDLAADLHHHAAKIPTIGDQIAPRPLRDLLADELSAIAVRSALFDYGHPEVPRAQILRELDENQKRFGGSAQLEDFRVLSLNLRRMADEDEQHLKNAKPFAQVSQQQQIAELIFQLRDQGGYRPQSNSVFRMKAFEDPIDHRVDHDPWPDAPNSPAQQLVKFGIAAAGQLIDHLDDDHLTRSMETEFGSSQVASLQKVLRVGDCAVLILERMSGRKFNGENRPPMETKRRISAWYAEVQKKGEKQTLIDGVHRGDEESYEQSLQLIAKHLAEAMPAIKVGLKAAKKVETRCWLLRAAGRLKDCDPLLLSELMEGPLPASRLEAAKILHRRGRPEAVAGMITLWTSEVSRKKPDGDDNRQLLAEIASTLIATEHAAAINAIAPHLQKCCVGLRQDVAEYCWGSLAPREGIFGGKRIECKLPADARTGLERILVALLDDTEEDAYRFPKSRTCDTAAQTFHEVSAKVYPFDAKASVQERDRAIREIRSVWRRMQEKESRSK